MTRSGVSCPGFDLERSIDRISLAALLLIDLEQEPLLEAVNAWLRQQHLRSVSALQYQEWARLHEQPVASACRPINRPAKALNLPYRGPLRIRNLKYVSAAAKPAFAGFGMSPHQARSVTGAVIHMLQLPA